MFAPYAAAALASSASMSSANGSGRELLSRDTHVFRCFLIHMDSPARRSLERALYIARRSDGEEAVKVQPPVGDCQRMCPPPVFSRVQPALTAAETRGRQSDGRACLLYTSDAADERSSVDLGGRR